MNSTNSASQKWKKCVYLLIDVVLNSSHITGSLKQHNYGFKNTGVNIKTEHDVLKYPVEKIKLKFKINMMCVLVDQTQQYREILEGEL